MGRIYFISLALAVLVALCAAPALAGTCIIRGTVTDAVGAPVQGAQVTLFDGDRSEITTVTTDAGGYFAFVDVHVNTDLCTVRVFYNDRHQTYTNAAYFTKWYPASGDVYIADEDTRLGNYHKPDPTTDSTSQPKSTPGTSGILSALALVTGATVFIYLRKEY